MPAAFRLRTSADGKHYFNLTAENNEIVLTSEMYASKQAAHKGIESVRTNSAVMEHYERREAADGRPYFVLKAANREIIGTSEVYATEAARENGIEAVRRVAPTAPVAEA